VARGSRVSGEPSTAILPKGELAGAFVEPRNVLVRPIRPKEGEGKYEFSTGAVGTLPLKKPMSLIPDDGG